MVIKGHEYLTSIKGLNNNEMRGKIFPKKGKCLTVTITDKRVPYSSSSLKPWKKRKYASELIPLKSYDRSSFSNS